MLLFFSCSDDSNPEIIVEEEEESSIVTVSFTSPTTSAEEDISKRINIPLKIEGSADKQVLVTYELSGSAGTLDVTMLTSSTFIIPQGASAYNIELIVIEDGIIEFEEKSLNIKLISISDGGKLGTQTLHTLVISPDDISLVGFKEPTSTLDLGSDGSIEVTLSQPIEDDITISFSFSSPSGIAIINGNVMPSDFYSDPEDLFIPAGSSSGFIQIPFSENAPNIPSSFEGLENIKLSLTQIEKNGFTTPQDIILDTDTENLDHSITLLEPPTELVIELNWTALTSGTKVEGFSFINIDLSEGLTTDSPGIESFSFDESGSKGTILMTLSNSLPNNSFGSALNTDVEDLSEFIIDLTITPKGLFTFNGSNSSITVSQTITGEDLSIYYLFIFSKNGNEFGGSSQGLIEL